VDIICNNTGDIKRTHEETYHKGDIVNDGREGEILKAVMRLNHASCTNGYFFEACGAATLLLTCVEGMIDDKPTRK
jgi:hypothetical protein